jgi:ABC-type phosphate transport system substrate-binding protein
MRTLPILLLSVIPAVLAQPIIVGHPDLQTLDRQTLERIYTGRVVEVNGVRVTPVNLPPGSETRERFLHDFLAQDEEKYTGYWTVRRYVGKGTPPKELSSDAAVLDYVSKNAGAIGYVDSVKAAAGVKILLGQP